MNNKMARNIMHIEEYRGRRLLQKWHANTLMKILKEFLENQP
jgi:hypothetical protein